MWFVANLAIKEDITVFCTSIAASNHAMRRFELEKGLSQAKFTITASEAETSLSYVTTAE